MLLSLIFIIHVTKLNALMWTHLWKSRCYFPSEGQSVLASPGPRPDLSLELPREHRGQLWRGDGQHVPEERNVVIISWIACIHYVIFIFWDWQAQVQVKWRSGRSEPSKVQLRELKTQIFGPDLNLRCPILLLYCQECSFFVAIFSGIQLDDDN